MFFWCDPKKNEGKKYEKTIEPLELEENKDVDNDKVTDTICRTHTSHIIHTIFGCVLTRILRNSLRFVQEYLLRVTPLPDEMQLARLREGRKWGQGR